MLASVRVGCIRATTEPRTGAGSDDTSTAHPYRRSHVYVLVGAVSNPAAGVNSPRAAATIAAAVRLLDPPAR